MQSAMPALILAVAIAIVSTPDPQYRLTVTPPTLSGKFDRRAIHRAICKPCSASGTALPTMISSIRLGSSCGKESNK